MIVYLDSSVVLRRLLGQPGALDSWEAIERGVGSELVELECLRTLDRLRLAGSLAEETLVELREAVFRLLATLEVVSISRPILGRAAQPMPTTLATLDAIHLATALAWQETFETQLLMATHDQALASASRAFGLHVLGT